MENYSQKNLISLFKAGKVEGEKSVPLHIKMPSSNVFIFDEIVYKIYKNDNDHINRNFRDISDKKDRFDFTKKDFAWNYALNNEIYIKLAGIIIKEECVNFTDASDSADELVIIMTRIDADSTLPLLMVEKKLSQADYENMGKQLAETLRNLPKAKISKKIADVMERRTEDVIAWVESEQENIKLIEKEKSARLLKAKLGEYLKKVSDDELGVCCDDHMENIVYEKGKLYIMDSYSFKEAWEIADKSINFYRPATDILVLAGEANYDSFKKGFLSVSPDYINQDVEDFLIFYSAMIMWPYMFMLKNNDSRRKDISNVYNKFILDNYLS